MATNKVVLGDEVLMDVSQDTVTPETLAKGVTAHNADGDPIVGTGINADTVDGWHVDVRSNGSVPTIPPKGTITFMYTVGG